MAQNLEYFDEFLWESFCNGRAQRELRLSAEELRYLQARYPLRAWEPIGAEKDGKCWYVIHPARPASAPLS